MLLRGSPPLCCRVIASVGPKSRKVRWLVVGSSGLVALRRSLIADALVGVPQSLFLVFLVGARALVRFDSGSFGGIGITSLRGQNLDSPVR